MIHHTTHPALSHAPAPGPPAGDSPLPAAAGRPEERHWPGGLLLLVALLLAIPALLPFFVEGLPRSFDGGTHLLRIGRLIDQIRSGTLFPRWTPELSLGYGYPVFSYYAPATYYLVAALHGLGLSIYHAFVAAFIGLMLVGALGLYRWGCALFGGNRRAASPESAAPHGGAPALAVPPDLLPGSEHLGRATFDHRQPVCAEARVEDAVVVDEHARWIEWLLGSVAQKKRGRAARRLRCSDRLHEPRGVLDFDVAPVVAVVQDGAAVDRVDPEPGVQRERQRRALDELALVPEATIAIEPDLALAREAIGGSSQEELRMIAWLHRSTKHCHAEGAALGEKPWLGPKSRVRVRTTTALRSATTTPEGEASPVATTT